MFRTSWGCLLVVTITFAARADEAPSAAAVKKLAQEMGVATLKGDYAKLIDQTYPTLVEQLGGREKAIETVTTLMKQMKDQGFILQSYDIGEPGMFLSEGGNTFVVLPARLEMTIPGGKMISKSFLLGISADKGKTWKFADGAGIIKQKEQREKLLPKLPADLKFPEQEKPEIIKDK